MLSQAAGKSRFLALLGMTGEPFFNILPRSESQKFQMRVGLNLRVRLWTLVFGLDNVFFGFQDAPGDPAAESDGVERLLPGEATQHGQVGA